MGGRLHCACAGAVDLWSDQDLRTALGEAGRRKLGRTSGSFRNARGKVSDSATNLAWDSATADAVHPRSDRDLRALLSESVESRCLRYKLTDEAEEACAGYRRKLNDTLGNFHDARRKVADSATNQVWHTAGTGAVDPWSDRDFRTLLGESVQPQCLHVVEADEASPCDRRKLGQAWDSLRLSWAEVTEVATGHIARWLMQLDRMPLRNFREARKRPCGQFHQINVNVG